MLTDISRHSIFYIATGYSFLIFSMSLFFRESRPSVLLQARFSQLVHETGINSLRFDNPDLSPTFSAFVKDSLARPLYLLFTEPLVAVCSVLKGVAFALIYGLTEAIPIVYTSFGFSATQVNLAFLPILLGVLFCTMNRVWDHKHLAKLSLSDVANLPELKMRTFVFSAPAFAVGLWVFAWTVPPVFHASWTPSMIALVLIGYATTDFDTILCGYLIDVSFPPS